MRIAIHDYAGHGFQTQLSRELARKGHTVQHLYGSGLLTPQGDLVLRPSDPPTLDFVSIPLHRDYRKYKYSFRRRRDMEIAYGRRLARKIRELNPDVVLSGNTPTEPQRSLQRVCQQNGIGFVPWIQDFYGLAVDRLVRQKINIPYADAWIGNYYKGLDRVVHNEADAIIVITDDFKSLLFSDGVHPRRVCTIPNWAVIDELPVKPKSNAWSLEQALNDAFVYLYSGTLAMKHNPALLRDLALQHLEDADVRIVVVSEGPGAEWLAAEKQRLGLENLVLLPFQPFSAMPDVLASADVLVAVLEPEAGIFSVPSKVLTYLCAQRALLLAVPRANLAARTVREQEAGLTVEPGNNIGFLNAAQQLYTDGPMRGACGQNARAYAERAFAIRDIAAQFEDILLQVAAQHDSAVDLLESVPVVVEEPPAARITGE